MLRICAEFHQFVEDYRPMAPAEQDSTSAGTPAAHRLTTMNIDATAPQSAPSRGISR